MTIENILVKIDTFNFPMDCVTWGIERDLQNSQILRRPLLSSSQAWINIKKGELTFLVGEEKAKFNLNQPLPLTEQERTMCTKICSLLPSRGYMFEESPFLIDVLASAEHIKKTVLKKLWLNHKPQLKGILCLFSLFKI